MCIPTPLLSRHEMNVLVDREPTNSARPLNALMMIEGTQNHSCSRRRKSKSRDQAAATLSRPINAHAKSRPMSSVKPGKEMADNAALHSKTYFVLVAAALHSYSYLVAQYLL